MNHDTLRIWDSNTHPSIHSSIHPIFTEQPLYFGFCVATRQINAIHPLTLSSSWPAGVQRHGVSRIISAIKICNGYMRKTFWRYKRQNNSLSGNLESILRGNDSLAESYIMSSVFRRRHRKNPLCRGNSLSKATEHCWACLWGLWGAWPWFWLCQPALNCGCPRAHWEHFPLFG